MKSNILPILFTIFLSMFVLQSHAYAFTTGGVGSAEFTPSTGSWQTGSTQDVSIIFSSGGQSVSSIAIRASIPVSSADIEVSGVDTNASLSGWSFLVKAIEPTATAIHVDIMAINTSISGAIVPAGSTLATIHLLPKKVFNAKTLTFDQTLSKIYKKSDTTDILGTLGNGSYNASGQTIESSPTPTIATTSMTTPTPTSAGGNIQPSCTNLYTNMTTITGTQTTITLTCYGSDPNGSINAAEFLFGDGKSQTIEKNVGTTGSISTTHQYTTIGSLGVSCRVKDNSNTWSEISSSCKKIITIKAKTAGSTISPTPLKKVSTIGVSQTPAAVLPVTIEQPQEITTPTEEPDIVPTLYPEKIDANDKSTLSNKIWWIVGGVITVLLAFLLLRKKNPPPQQPPIQQYTQPQPVQQYPEPQSPEPQTPVIQN